MNIYSILGFIIAIVVLFGGLLMASEDMSLFINYPSMFIVLGGTFAAASISFQLNRLTKIIKIFFKRIIKGQKYDYADTIRLMMTLSDQYRKGESIKNLVEKSDDYFLNEALTIIDDGILNNDEAVSILIQRNERMMYNNMEEANKMKAIGKFPPAFGMIGTTIGMIVLLANLGGEDAMKMIGPAMGICLITTLYGAVVANLGFIPVADNLMDGTKEVFLKNQIIIEGIKLLLVKTNPIVVAEKLNSFVNPSDRLNWKEAVGQ